MGQGLGDSLIDRPIHQLSVREPQLHLSWMDVHIQCLLIDLKMQHHERILVLHHKWPVGLLDRLCHDIALDVASVDEIVLHVPVAPGDHRLPDRPGDPHIAGRRIYRKEVGGDLPSEHCVDHILDTAVAGGAELVLVILDKSDGDIRPGQGDLLHQLRHVRALCGRCL